MSGMLTALCILFRDERMKHLVGCNFFLAWEEVKIVMLHLYESNLY